MAVTNLTGSGTQRKTVQEAHCSHSLEGGLQQHLYYLSAVNIFLSIGAFLGNSLILVAFRRESYLHPPSKLLYRCLATTDLLVGLVSQPLTTTYWMSIVYEHWSLCRYARDAAFITSYALCGVSLSTMTAISVDRLLALLLGLRYKQIVTLKRTFFCMGTFWAVNPVAALSYILDHRIVVWYSSLGVPFCLAISVVCYSKIFHNLNRHHAQVQDHVEQQLSQPNTLNIARYRKAVYSALWVQLSLVVCYLPFVIVDVVISRSKIHSSHLASIREISVSLIYFNSTLNPFLYCWKISEVRQSVKQTIREAVCCF
ncbi:melanocortin receptor 5-like [Stylophora pistillata]|uniref:melanocortin receptor 5-like n=1 Tax=Stylophora pistillata TaxID=50429 RepID=UPI000C056AA4|nr:melanocortin receptor 5-like [Stylophora pistillata]